MSDYLDNICPPDGAKVRCKVDLLGNLEAGVEYTVCSKPAPDGGVYKGVLVNGRFVIPSARFDYEPAKTYERMSRETGSSILARLYRERAALAHSKEKDHAGDHRDLQERPGESIG